MARMTLDEIRAKRPKPDQAKLDSTTEEDIRRFQINDGYDPNAPPGDLETVIPPQVIRKRLAMTQQEFALALRIPIATLRNWEQGRVRPDPAARALLKIVFRNPQAALSARAE